MGQKNKIINGCLYFMTFTIVDWIDLFTRPNYKHIIIESLRYCQNNKGLIIHAWCLMSNHLHLIISSDGKNNLSSIIRDFKKYTSKKIVEEMNRIPESRKKWILKRFEFAGKYNKKIKNYKVWKDGNEAKIIETTDFLIQKINYIHHNPVKAEIVDNPEDYKYSSAKDYCGMKGLLEIVKI